MRIGYFRPVNDRQEKGRRTSQRPSRGRGGNTQGGSTLDCLTAERQRFNRPPCNAAQVQRWRTMSQSIRVAAANISKTVIASLHQRRGMIAKIARAAGVTHATAWTWQAVPLDHVFAVERATGIPAIQLRPDFFLTDPTRSVHTFRFVSQRMTTPAPPPRGLPKLTDKHRAIWFDPDITSEKAAVKAILATDHVLIPAHRMRRKFGSRRPRPSASG